MFIEITGDDYTELLIKRLQGTMPELTWLRQFRQLLTPFLRPKITMLDVGCATGYAYNSFKEFQPCYVGLDFEKHYLQIATEWFAKEDNVRFMQHNIIESPPDLTAQIVICNAMIEHCASLMPALKHLAEASENILVLRLFLGESQQIYHVPSPVDTFRETHIKYVNQYSFSDVLGFLEQQGFRTTVYRDEHSESVPQYVNGAVRTFFIVFAQRPEN